MELTPTIAEPTQRNYPAGKAFGGLLCLALVFVTPALWLSPGFSEVPNEFGNLSEATVAEIRTGDGTVVMSGEFRTRVDSLGNIEKDAALLGRRQEQVIGEIEVEIPRPEAADQRQELEVDIISLDPRSTYSVVINDRPVTMFTTDDRGSIDIEILSAP
jgi:hypothetical protein